MVPPSAVASETFPNPRTELVPLADIAEGENPRQTFDKEAMDELIASVKEKGVEVAVILRPMPLLGDGRPPLGKLGKKYQLVAGERRFRAATAAKLTHIKAEIRFDLDNDRDAFETALIENMSRQDLNPFEQALAFKRLNEVHKVSVEDIAKKFGRKVEVVYNRLKLAELKGEARKAVAAGELGAQIGVDVARLPTELLQDRAMKQFKDAMEYDGGLKNLSFREAEGILDNGFRRPLKDAHFKQDDAQLLPKAGACTTCPKRSKGTCYDVECFMAKDELGLEAKQLDVAEQALAKGLEVMEPEQAEAAIRNSRSYGNSKFIDLEAQNYRDDKGRKWREIVGDKVAPIVAVDGQGKAHQLVPVEQLKEVLKEKGLNKLAPASSSARSPDYAAQERRKNEAFERRERVVEAVIPRLVEAAEKRGLDEKLARLVVEQFGNFERIDTAGLFERRELKNAKAFEELVAKSKGPQLAGIIVEALAADGAGGSWTTVYRHGFKSVCEAYGINIDKAEAELKAANEKAERDAEAAKEAAKKAKAATEKKPEPPAKKKDTTPPGVNAKTGKPRRMAIQEG